MIASVLPRVFIYQAQQGEKAMELADTNNTMSPDAIRSFYAALYPLLTTATVEGPHIENDRVVYYFKNSLGTKG